MNTIAREFRHSDTIHVNYEIHGYGPGKVVLLHGFAAALTTWDDIRGRFRPDRFTLYLLDLPGFGLSSKPRRHCYLLTEQAEVVRSFLAANDLRDVSLVGHSLGGSIALIVYFQGLDQQENRVARLVLLDCPPYPQRLPRFFRLLRLPLANRFILSVVPVSYIVDRALRGVYHDLRTMTPARISRYRTCFSHPGTHTVLIRTVKGLERSTVGEITSRYRSISVPVLIIWGSEDRVVTLSQGKRLAKEIPHARLAVIDSCGHNPHEERPEETYSLIAGFMKETSEW